MQHGHRNRPRSIALLGALAMLVLLTACLPTHPTRQEGSDRAVAAAELLGQIPGIEAHQARLEASFAPLTDIPELQPLWEEMLGLIDQMQALPAGAEATALRTQIDAIVAQIIAEPAAAPLLDDLRATLQLLRNDVPAAEQFDSSLRGISDASIAPTTYFSPKIGVFGDSGALSLRSNSGPYTGTKNPNKKLRLGSGFVTVGCGTLITNSTCGTPAQWAASADNNATHVALVYAGIWETKCWQFEGWPECHHLGEPIFDDYIRRNLDARTEALLGAGVSSVIYVKTNRGPGTDGTDDTTYLDRWDRWRELLDEHAARYDRVEVLDIVPWWTEHRDRDMLLRPDGYHFTTNSWEFWRDALEPMLFWDRWLPRFGRQYHLTAPWAPVLGTLWAQTTPAPLVTGAGISTTTTTSPPATTTTLP